FSSRRRHTRSKRDWSSDVCSSDLEDFFDGLIDAEGNLTPLGQIIGKVGVAFVGFMTILTGLMAVVWVVGGTIAAFGAIMESALRSEERRVGKESRSRWS